MENEVIRYVLSLRRAQKTFNLIIASLKTENNKNKKVKKVLDKLRQDMIT